MKTLLVKRIDSSFTAFKGSLNRFQQASQAMLTMFEQGRIIIAPKLKVSEYILEEREDELLDKIIRAQETDPSIAICAPSDFEASYLPGLQTDHQRLTELVKRWQQVTADLKFDRFYQELNDRLLNPTHNPAQKLVIFSESKETTAYLTDRLRQAGRDDLLSVHSGNRTELMKQVRANFDANLPPSKQKDAFNIVITTEVLAEGVNLHRANTVVNYDTPWNATRLMQRIGRVNRIGSKSSHIFVYNFYPTTQVDNDIELRKKAVMKLQAFHSALGEDSQIYSTEEEVDTFGLFEESPAETRDERLDYLMELRDFKAKHPAEFRRIKAMPLRARTGRASADSSNGTLVFVRNNQRNAFSFVDTEGQLTELSFEEAAKRFKAEVSEPAQPLIAQHHAHVQQAVDAFWEQLTRERQTDKRAEKIGPQERLAVEYLAALLNWPGLTLAQHATLKAAQQAIKAHRFSQLSKKLNQFRRNASKAKLTTHEILEKVLTILEGFPLEVAPDAEPKGLALEDFQALDQEPAIIISESFG